MAKRTRRDLSNPDIKRIIREQTASGANRGFSSKQPSGGNGRKTFLIWLVVLMTAGAAAFVFMTDRFDGFMASAGETDPAEITTNQPVEKPAEPNPQPAKVQEQQNTQPEPELKPVARRVQVEILNGCGVNGLAEKLTRYLRQYDIDVVSRGNYRHFEVPASRIVDRINSAERVEPLAKLLGISSRKIVVEENINLQLDATIVLGLDYKTLKPFKE